MPATVDNLLAFKILQMLTTPFEDTEAYKLGIIDKDGNTLIQSKDFIKPEQKEAFTYLIRLVFNIKKILNKLPGGESKLKNLIAALFLIKESYTKNTPVKDTDFYKIIDLLDEGYILVEEQSIIDKYMSEDIANVTGHAVSTDEPVAKNYKVLKRKLKKNVHDIVKPV